MTGIAIGSIAGIALYLGLIAFIGYRAWRKNIKGNLDDQYLVSRNLNVFVLVGTLFATWFSTFAFLGGPGTFYLNGVNWLVFPLFNSLGPVLIWVFGSRMWALGRRFGFVTPSDLLATYYDDSRRVRVTAAIVGVAVLFPYAAVQLSGISKAVASATANVVTYETTILLVGVSVALYSILGGSRAVVWTDTIQGFIFAGLLVATAVLTVFWAGGWSSGWAATQRAQPEKLAFSGETASTFFTLGLLWTFGWVLVPHLWQRMYMARSPKIMAKSMVLASGLSLWVVTFTGAIIGFLAMGIFEEIPGGFDSDALTPLLFREFLPVGAVVLVVATFAAGMSTLDSQVLSGSSIFTLDIYRVGKPEASESALSRVGKFFEAAFVIGLVGFTLIPAGQALLVPLASVGVGFALCFLMPLIGALYWPRASERAAFWSMTLGFAVMIALQLAPALLDPLPFSFGPAAWGFFVAVAVFYAGSVFGSPVSREKISMFHGTLDTVMEPAARTPV